MIKALRKQARPFTTMSNQPTILKETILYLLGTHFSLENILALSETVKCKKESRRIFEILIRSYICSDKNFKHNYRFPLLAIVSNGKKSQEYIVETVTSFKTVGFLDRIYTEKTLSELQNPDVQVKTRISTRAQIKKAKLYIFMRDVQFAINNGLDIDTKNISNGIYYTYFFTSASELPRKYSVSLVGLNNIPILIKLLKDAGDADPSTISNLVMHYLSQSIE